MKSVRKPLIFSLILILIFSSVNITAFAVDTDDTASGAVQAAETIVVTAIQAVPEPVPAQEPAMPLTGASDPYAVPADASDDRSAVPASDPMLGVVLKPGEEIAVYAVQFNGSKYVYGAASPSVGFDCSGLAYYVYKQFGYTLPRTAHLQYRSGTTVEKADLQPGDLVFFATYGGRSVTHVGFYIGNNQFIHAATKKNGVMISSLDNSYWKKAWVGAKRIITIES